MTADRLGTIDRRRPSDAAIVQAWDEWCGTYAGCMQVITDAQFNVMRRARELEALAAEAAPGVGNPHRIDTDAPSIALSRFVDGFMRGRATAIVSAKALYSALSAYVIGHPAFAAPAPPAATVDAVTALRRFVADAQEVDLGGGDAVVTTCESLEMARAALSAPEARTAAPGDDACCNHPFGAGYPECSCDTRDDCPYYAAPASVPAGEAKPWEPDVAAVMEGVAAWLLHRFGPHTPEAGEAETLNHWAAKVRALTPAAAGAQTREVGPDIDNGCGNAYREPA